MAAIVLFAGLAIVAVAFTLLTILRLAIRLVLFPLFLLKWLVAALVMLIVGPVLAIVGVALAVVFALVVAVPLLPLLALAAMVWLLVKISRRPAVA